MPNNEISIGNIRLKLLYVGIVLVLLDLPGLFSDNAGGTVAHFGGYLLGLFYAVQLRNGTDIGRGFGEFADKFFRLFSFKKRGKLKTVHRRKKKAYAGMSKDEFNTYNDQKKIDIILDKIGKSGYESLTEEEKEFLFRSGKD